MLREASKQKIKVQEGHYLTFKIKFLKTVFIFFISHCVSIFMIGSNFRRVSLLKRYGMTLGLLTRWLLFNYAIHSFIWSWQTKVNAPSRLSTCTVHLLERERLRQFIATEPVRHPCEAQKLHCMIREHHLPGRATSANKQTSSCRCRCYTSELNVTEPCVSKLLQWLKAQSSLWGRVVFLVSAYICVCIAWPRADVCFHKFHRNQVCQ